MRPRWACFGAPVLAALACACADASSKPTSQTDTSSRETGPADASELDTGAGDHPDSGAPPADAISDSGVDSRGDDTSGQGEDRGGELTDVPPTSDAGGGCSYAVPGAESGSRVVLIGHTFSSELGEPGTEIRSLTLDSNGRLQDNGVRRDLAIQPSRIAFLPSGDRALVLGAEGALVSLAVSSTTEIEEIDRVTLPFADFGDLRIEPQIGYAYAVGSDSVETGGISSVEIACDGTLTHRQDLFFSLRLAETMALGPSTGEAIVVGGQTVFDPVDDDDIRRLSWGDDGWREVGAFDIYTDFIDSGRIALSPDRATLLVPNGSPFSDEGGQVAVIAVGPTGLSESRRLMDLSDAQEALFSVDGETALISLFEPGQIAVLARPGGNWQEVDRIAGVGLADQMAAIERGPLAGLVLIASVDVTEGSNIASVRIDGAGEVTDLGQLPLGSGAENIPESIAVMP